MTSHAELWLWDMQPWHPPGASASSGRDAVLQDLVPEIFLTEPDTGQNPVEPARDSFAGSSRGWKRSRVMAWHAALCGQGSGCLQHCGWKTVLPEAGTAGLCLHGAQPKPASPAFLTNPEYPHRIFLLFLVRLSLFYWNHQY